MENYIHTLAELVAAETLRQAGLTSGEMTSRKARDTYGTWFAEVTRNGRLSPCRADGKCKWYSIPAILALKAEDYRRAELLK